MQERHTGERDLMGSLRSQAKITDPSQVKEARLERNGQISVIPCDRQPEILQVAVQEGVQTVQIKLE